MLDILREYLSEAAPPAVKDAVEAAHQAFERVQLPAYEEGFEELLLTDDTNDTGGTVDSIIRLTQQLQSKILAEHGIVLHEDTSLEVGTILIEGLVDLPDYGDPDRVWQTASMDGSTEEVFAELMALVTPYPVEEVLVAVESVSTTLITRVKDVVPSPEERALSDADRATQRNYLHRLQGFCQLIDNSQLKIVALLQQGLDVGFPLATYADTIGRDLESLSPEAAAHELIAMAIVSSDCSNNIAAGVQQQLDHYIANLNLITRITIVVRDLVVKAQL